MRDDEEKSNSNNKSKLSELKTKGINFILGAFDDVQIQSALSQSKLLVSCYGAFNLAYSILFKKTLLDADWLKDPTHLWCRLTHTKWDDSFHYFVGQGIKNCLQYCVPIRLFSTT